MRWLTLALVALIALLQYPLWIGKGGWLRVWDVSRQLEQQKEANGKLMMRNSGLDAEVRDLKQGFDAIEERARFELGMIKQNEVFVQIPDRGAAASEDALPPPASAAPARSSVGSPPAAGRAR
jgi:cell division protein FtsB